MVYPRLSPRWCPILAACLAGATSLPFPVAPLAPAQDAPRSPLPFRLSTKDSKTPEVSAKPDPGPPASADPGVRLGLAAKTVQIPPELTEIAQQAARAVTERKWNTARTLYLQMVEKAPDNPLVYANLGVAEYQLKNYLAAEGNLKKSLELNPSIAQNWMTLGLIQYERGDLLLAISSLSRAIHEDPNSASAHLYLAAVVYEHGWPIAAIKELKRVIEIEPRNAQAHFNLAMTYLGLTPPKVELARRHYYHAIDLGAEPSSEIERALAESSE